ncbi:MAG: hypothetical protein ACXAC0_09230 [Candidatus Thorarchaeota archaeon]
MSSPRNGIDKRKVASLLIAVVIIVVGFVGVANIIDNIPTTYHYEAWLPESSSRDTRFTIAGIDDANITVTFADEPGLWYRLDVTHYSSVKRHGVNDVSEPTFLPLRAHLTSVTPVKNINLVFGTDVAHRLYISGENLNTFVKMDNGAKISGSKCRFYGTGVFQFIMTENINFTSEGMDVRVGDSFLDSTSPELVVLDIDLPTGLSGRLSSPNATFIQNDWPINYGDQWGTNSIDEPLLDIKIFYSKRVWASLRI